MTYNSDLTDDEWNILEPLMPYKKLTRPLIWTKREIMNGVLYQLKNGCNWVDLPKDLPPYSTVFCTPEFVNKPKKTEMDNPDHHRFSSRSEHL
jgi:transposase